jgi:hypothetical protein
MLYEQKEIAIAPIIDSHTFTPNARKSKKEPMRLMSR